MVTRLLSLSLLGAGLACAPTPDVAPRVRTGPTLVPVGDCDEVFATFVERLTRDTDDRVLANAYADMEAGLFGPSGPPLYVEEPYAVAMPPGGAVPGVSPFWSDGARVFAAGDLDVFLFDVDAGGLGPLVRIPVYDATLWGTVQGFVVGPDGTVYVISTTVITTASGRDDSSVKGYSPGTVTVVDVLDPAGAALVDARRWVITGELRAVDATDEGLTVVTEYLPSLPPLDFSPRYEGLFGVGGTAQAVINTQSKNHLALATVTRDQVLPRVASALDELDAAVPESCNNIDSTRDSTGYRYVTFARLPAEGGPVSTDHVLTESATLGRVGEDWVMVTAAQGPSWHLGTDEPPMSNLHEVTLDDDDLSARNHRQEGWAAWREVLVVAGRPAVLLSTGQRSVYSYALADPALVWLDRAPTPYPLLRPLAAPTYAVGTGHSAVVGFDLGAPVRMAVESDALVPRPLPPGALSFAAELSPDRLLTVSRLPDGGLRAAVVDDDGVALSEAEVFTAETAAPTPGPEEPVAVVDVYDVTAVGPRYDEAHGLLLYPLSVFTFDEVAQVGLEEHSLVVIQVEGETLTRLGAVSPATSASDRAPIVAYFLTEDALYVRTYAQLAVYGLEDLALIDAAELPQTVPIAPEPVR